MPTTNSRRSRRSLVRVVAKVFVPAVIIAAATAAAGGCVNFGRDQVVAPKMEAQAVVPGPGVSIPTLSSSSGAVGATMTTSSPAD